MTYYSDLYGKELNCKVTTSQDLCNQFGMLIWPEAKILKVCALMLPDNPIIVNVGAGAGTSAVAILEERPDAFIFSVDKNVAELERINLQLCGMDLSRCVRLLGRSWTVGENFPYFVNMVFIDADHGTVAVKKDIDVWIPKIISGGVAAFHDYKHPNVPDLTGVVDRSMVGHKVIDEYRYMIAYTISD
jgi:predicted O-methyltransferase YrrM